MKSWNEIRKAATAFSKRWKNAYDEKAQAQSFLKEFFAVFGVDAVTVATFEHRVKFADGSQGYADCFWPGTILVEMKSRGKDLDAAFEQAMEYVRTMCNVANVEMLPIANSNSQLKTGNIGTGNTGNNSTFSYIFGNPPFLGSTWQNAEQRTDLARLFPNSRNLDFVCCWYKKASYLIQGTSTRCAFVSTNSITQGEQVALLWKNLNVEIDFAYRTFKWHNEAKGNAAVHCVIIGFHTRGGNEHDTRDVSRTIYLPDGTSTSVAHINSYLMDAEDIFIESRQSPLCDVPEMRKGNQPTDGGHLIIEDGEYEDFIFREPAARQFIRPLIGSREYINSLKRWCLWLKDVPPLTLRAMPLVMERVAKCRDARLASRDPGARKLAVTPTLFRETNNPRTAVIIPEVSSETRFYVPIGFIDASVICTNKIQIIPEATLYHFAVLTSRIHMVWMRTVAGRLKSDYSYSKQIVYNNFVWPSPSDDLKAKIESAAQAVLNARARYPDQTLAALYDPLTMPPDLVKAHAHLDALVDKAYGLSPSCTDADRVAHLFKLYAEKVNKA